MNLYQSKYFSDGWTVRGSHSVISRPDPMLPVTGTPALPPESTFGNVAVSPTVPNTNTLNLQPHLWICEILRRTSPCSVVPDSKATGWAMEYIILTAFAFRKQSMSHAHAFIRSLYTNPDRCNDLC